MSAWVHRLTENVITKSGGRIGIASEPAATDTRKCHQYLNQNGIFVLRPRSPT